MKACKLYVVCFAISALVLGAVPVHAQLAVGARALGMGGAFTAVADDISAPYWNPSGLSRVAHFQLQPLNLQVRIETSLDWKDVVEDPPTDDDSRLELLKDLGQGTTELDFSANSGFVMPNFAVTVIPLINATLNADIEIDPNTEQPRIYFEHGEPTVPSTGVITGAGSVEIGISMSKRIKNDAAIGVTIKSVKNKGFSQVLRYKANLVGPDPTNPADYDVVDDSPAAVETDDSGLGIDVGYLRDVSPTTTIGVMVRNLIEPGGAGTFGDRAVNIGIAHRLPGDKVLLAADLANAFNKPSINLGAEFKVGKPLRLWAGFYENKPTLGMGLNLLGIKLQFAYSPRNTSVVSGALYF